MYRGSDFAAASAEENRNLHEVPSGQTASEFGLRYGPSRGYAGARQGRGRIAEQRNGGSADQKRGQDLGGGTGSLASGHHEPQYQQGGCHCRGANDGG